MASAATLPAPPGQDSGPPPSPNSAAASPSPAQPSQADNHTKLVVAAVSALRAVAKAIPAAAPGITKINEIWSSEVMPAIMKGQQIGEPQAPPMAG